MTHSTSRSRSRSPAPRRSRTRSPAFRKSSRSPPRKVSRSPTPRKSSRSPPRKSSRSPRSRSKSARGRSHSRSRSGSARRDVRGHKNNSPRRSRSRSRSRPRNRVNSGSRDPKDCCYDASSNGYRLYVCDFQDPSTSEVVRAFEKYGHLSEHPFIAKSAKPCFGFISYDKREDAVEACEKLHGSRMCGGIIRVSFAKPRAKGRGFDPSMRCYQCGRKGHLSRDCGPRGYGSSYGGGRRDYGRPRSRSGGRRRSRSRSRGRYRSRSR